MTVRINTGYFRSGCLLPHKESVVIVRDFTALKNSTIAAVLQYALFSMP